ncbi:MAG: ABC transporter permease [Acidobacteria bacterium]|nr:ABC transporter permease [Acidobacteriota bacterium]MBV9434593.1 ABC transporter permease [Acidobacteriota bacterium]
MTRARWIAAGLLVAVFLLALCANVLAPSPYARQFRSDIDHPPSHQFPLGTDDLGRDRFSRLLYGMRISLLLAPAAAFISVLLAAVIGGAGAYAGGLWDRSTRLLIDLFLSLPWLFLLLTVRALLPLDIPALTSVTLTFALLGTFGWAASARVVSAEVRELRNSEFVLQARAAGCPRARLLFRHVLPNVKPILLAQFWISVPLFILTEANLGMLGLGVTEPLPSWGNLLRELENYGALRHSPWLWAPLVSLVLVVSLFQFVVGGEEYAS